MELTKQSAAQELLKRREIRANLVSWARYFGSSRGWVPAKHHELLLNKLQQVTDGILLHSKTGLPCSNLIVLMPPGAAKSSYASVVFPIWFLQRRPTSRILACSHAADLIESFSRECRNGVANFAKILGYGLLSDSRAVQEWSTTNGGSYRCAGVGAGIAGRRADAGVIDDYLGSQEDADSKQMRDKQWAWYLNDFWPRLKPNAVQVIVANRRHEDDLVGRLLEKEANLWEVIRIPFFAEQEDVLGRALGEPLWPEWFNKAIVEGVKALPARTQACLYGQRPAPEEGNYFKSDWLKPYSRDQYDALMEKEPRIYGAGDWAVSEDKDANRTCFGGVAMDEKRIIYVLPDLFWKTSGPKEVITSYLDFLKRRNPLVFWSESGHIAKAWGPFLREMMMAEHVYSHITEVVPSKAKDVRARAIQGLMSMHRVRFPTFATWWPLALHELLMFPGGKTDDFVDFLAHIGMGVLEIMRLFPQKVDEFEDIAATPVLTYGWLKKADKEKRSSAAKYAGR